MVERSILRQVPGNFNAIKWSYSVQYDCCYLQLVQTEHGKHTLTDEELMSHYARGDMKAFELLYERHKGGLYRYLLRQLAPHGVDANELFQDIWLSIIRSREQYTPKALFSTYLYRIAHNRLVDYWRKAVPHETDCELETLVDESMTPEQEVEQLQTGERLKQLLTLLPEAQRSAFLLKEEAGLTLEQIAEVTGSNRETIKSRLRYALDHLRRCFNE